MPRNIPKLDELTRKLAEKEAEIVRLKDAMATITFLIQRASGGIDLPGGVLRPDGRDEERPATTKATKKTAEKPRKCINCQELLQSGYDRTICPDCLDKGKDYLAARTDTQRRTDADKVAKDPRGTLMDQIKSEVKEGVKPSDLKRKKQEEQWEAEALKDAKPQAITGIKRADALRGAMAEVKEQGLKTELLTPVPKKSDAEKANSHDLEEGKEGDAEYQRLLAKEGKAAKKYNENCPHCNEELEEPVTRGYHQVCLDAIKAKEKETA